MRIYAISDLHGRLPEIPSDAELLLLGGDICPDFRNGTYGVGDRPGAAEQAAWLDLTFREWLESRPSHCDVVAIWGNHDFVGEVRSLVPKLPWVLLQDRLYYYTRPPLRDVKLTIYGTPWVPGLPRWAFHGSDRALEGRADDIPQCDILLSHGPPHGAGDYIPGGEGLQANKYGNYHGINVGDKALVDRLKRPDAPKLLICGHIHEDRGVHRLASTEILNVAAVDGDYQLHEEPWTEVIL